MMAPSAFNRLVPKMRFVISIDHAARQDQARTALAQHFAPRIAPVELDEVFELVRVLLSREVTDRRLRPNTA